MRPGMIFDISIAVPSNNEKIVSEIISLASKGSPATYVTYGTKRAKEYSSKLESLKL